MSLENQVTRVSIGMKDTLKTLINKLGGNVTDELIDQYPELAASLDQVDTAGSAAQALSDAKKYTDQKISEIPTPDVSGQINTHNTNTSAHSDIRTAISNHATNADIHVTADEKSAWNDGIKLANITFTMPVLDSSDVGYETSSNKWLRLAYGNGRFVAVPSGSSGSDVAAYSDDGIVWNTSTLPVAANWSAITYGGDKFIAIANNSDIAVYSMDGITWTQEAMPVSEYWSCVTYGNGKFIAIAGSGDNKRNIGAYSLDGITWTQVTMPYTVRWRSVTYGNGRFVAVAYSCAVSAYSDDGITWTGVTMPGSSMNWEEVAYGNGRFIAGGLDTTSNRCLAYSEDGISWTQIKDTQHFFRSICYYQGSFYGVGYSSITSPRTNGWYSSDGVSWQTMDLPFKSLWNTIVAGNNQLVALSYSTRQFAYSEDGVNWSNEVNRLHTVSGTDVTAEVKEIIGASSSNVPHAATHATGGSDPITPESIGAAPAGYGLGESTPTLISNCNIVGNGWYRVDASTANIPDVGLTSGVLRIDEATGSLVYQSLYFYVSGKVHKMERVHFSGTWYPWEYINPPMELGVEYRTTERHLGNPVYKKIDSDGVIWWSTDQTTWNMEADRVGAASKNYVISRGENLITNGSALLGDNTNFSKFTFDGSDTYGAGGCFVSSDNTESSSHLILTDEYMPVDISKAYDFSYYIKTSSSSAKYYSFLDMFDIDKNEIKYDNVTWVSGTTTTLASELKKGDTTVILTSVSNWIDSQYDHQRGFIFWNYTNSFGYQYPIETYSRNKYANQWANGTNAINTSANTITLSSAWSGPTYPAGTSVSQCTSGSTYVYLDAGTTKTANTWVKQRFTMLPSQFRDGTAFVKCGWLMNYFNSGGSDVTTKLSTVSVTCQSNIPIMQTVTLTSANWNSSAKTQTITVPGVLANETKQLIIPAPALESQTAYYNAGIRCTGQAADNLTFTAKTIPTADLTVYVTIQEVGA